MSSAEDTENIRLFYQHQHGYLFTRIMITACELGIFDLLMESGAPLSSEAIAERLGASPHGIEILLDACVALKLLIVKRIDGKALYENSDTSKLYLTKSSPKSQCGYMLWNYTILDQKMRYLADAVREGKNQNKKIFESTSDCFFDDASGYSSEERCKMFLNFMNSSWVLFGREIVAAFDLSLFPLICDLGGGGGALAKECISLYPNSTVTILDLPQAVATAKKYFIPSEEGRIVLHEGDFFKDPLPEADLYFLARVLQDWDDEQCTQLLTKVYNACKPGGGVLVAEMVFSEDKSWSLEAHLESILLLLFTNGGKRTFSKFSTLFRAAGFQEIQIKQAGLYHVILGRK